LFCEDGTQDNQLLKDGSNY